MTHWVRTHYRGGRLVRGHWRRNPGGGGPGGPGLGGGVVVIVVVFVVAAALLGGLLLRPRPGKSARSEIAENALFREAKAGFERADATLKVDHPNVKMSVDFDTDCVKHSEGELREYFLSHACKHIARAYMQVGDVERNLVLVAISWVEMPDTATAREYQRLVDADVGNIIELSRETRSFKNITYEDRTYMFGAKGGFVWQVEIRPVLPKVPDSVVNSIVEKVRQ